MPAWYPSSRPAGGPALTDTFPLSTALSILSVFHPLAGENPRGAQRRQAARALLDNSLSDTGRQELFEPTRKAC
jgi:hypothetical protein